VPVSTVTATGATGKAFAKMASLLSACPTFQSAMGGLTEAAALNLIDYPYWRNDNSDTPADQAFDTQPVPGCTIARVDDLDMRWAIYRNSMFQGDLMVEFRMDIDPAHAGNSKDRLIDFMNKVDAILDEAFDRANVTDVSNVHAIELNEPINELVTPQETNPDLESDPDGKPFLIAAYIIEVTA